MTLQYETIHLLFIWSMCISLGITKRNTKEGVLLFKSCVVTDKRTSMARVILEQEWPNIVIFLPRIIFA